MSCSNCFNGCAEIVSDQCVRYTGIDVPILGIKSGDSLSYVEQALIEFLTSTLNGTGITLDINPAIICNIVNKNLVACKELSLPNVIDAIIKAVCELDARLVVVENKFIALDGPYTIGCLTGVTSTSGTHAILQAVITKLCAHIVDFNAFVLDVQTNYVKKSQLCALVAACTPPAPVTQFKDRMVPYAVVEYYGSLTNFDLTGAGISANGFDKIYLCNGNNGTPDKRGRLPVGAIQGVPGGALNPVVDPTVAGNPNYSLNTTQGANTVILTSSQIPAHTHTATATSIVTDPGHKHNLVADTWAGTGDRGNSVSPSGPDCFDWQSKARINVVDTGTTGITVATSVVNAPNVGGQSHNNIPPVLACYYIMYIP